MRLKNFTKLTPEERDAAWAKMDPNRRNELVGEAMGKRVVAHSWPCFSWHDGGEEAEWRLPLDATQIRRDLASGEYYLWPVYVPEIEERSSIWPPEPNDEMLPRCERVAVLELLPDFVGDMGAAYEIVEWLRTKYKERGKGLMRFMVGIKNQHPSRSWWYLIRWWFLTADWPEVLGRAVVEAVIARGEVPG